MKIKNYTIWILMVISVLVIGGLLLKNSLMHQEVLDKQAVKNAELLKFSFINQYEEFCNEFEDRLRIEKVRTKEEILKDYKVFFDFFNEKNKLDPIYFSPECNLKKLIEHKLEFFDSEKLIHFHPDVSNNDIVYKVNIPFEKLFIKYKPYTFFDQIFLTDDQGIVKWSNNQYFGTKLIDFNKIVKNGYHNFSVTKGEILLNNEPYLIYFTQVEIDGLKFNLAGIISVANFKTVGFRLDHTLTTYLIFLLILVFASIPIISVLSLKKGDVLTKSKVYSCGLSLLAILLFLGGFTSMNLRQLNPEREKIIQKSGEETGLKEAKTMYYQRLFEIKNKISCPDPFLEYTNDGFTRQIIKVDSNNGSLSEMKMFYMENLMSFNVPVSTIILSDRKYVNYFNYPKNNQNYIGSHFSRLNGELESVVSRKIGSDIEAITFSLTNKNKDSNLKSDPLNLIDSANRILIIKGDGKVIHKSEKLKSPIDSVQQFLSQEKWLQLKYILTNNSASAKQNDIWEIPLHLDGLDYRAYVSYLGDLDFDQPLWFIYFKNKNPEEIKSSLISIESAIYFFLYILLLIVISILTKIFKPAKPKYNWSSFSYGFLKPDGNNENSYILLAFVFLITGFTVFILMSYLNFLGSFYIISLTLFFVSILIRIMIKPPKSDSRPDHLNKSMSKKFIWVLIVIVMILSILYFRFFLVGENEGFFISYFYIFLSITVFWIFKQQKSLTCLEKLNLKIKLNTAFSLFLFLWFILIGYIPGLFIAEKISNYEESVWRNLRIELNYTENENFNWIDGFEENRRIFFSSISTPFYEQEVKSFISPNKNLLREAIVQPKNHLNLTLFSIICILFVLGLIYWIIYFLTKKLFWLDSNLKFLTNNYFKYKRENEKLFSNGLKIFLCGVTTEICRDYINQNIKKDDELLVKIDCNLTPNLEINFNSTLARKNNEIWLIENIHCLKDQSLLIEKFPILIKKATDSNIILVVSSGISWKEMVKSLPNRKSQIIYSEIFSSFYFDYVPIDRVPNMFEIEKDPKNDEMKSNQNIKYEIFDERSISRFLNSSLDSSELLMNFNLYVQRYGKAYFYNIWSELTFGEKKICFFYSKEGLVNYANYEMVVELIQKGIFHIDDKTKKIKLFSDGFRSFVLSQESNELLEEFNKDEKRNGNGMTVEIAVISFIFIMLALLSFFDKNFLNQTTTIVTGTAGLLGSLYSLLGRIFPSFQGKQ